MSEKTKESNTDNDLRKFIEEDRKRAKKEKWEGIVLNFLRMVRENPELGGGPASRVYKIIESKGTEIPPKKLGLKEGIVKHKFFTDHLYGIEETIHEIVMTIKDAAFGGEMGKRLILLVGPTSTGKSTMVELMFRGLEKEGSFYAIKDCETFCNPLWATPRHTREDLREKFGIRIDEKADICPWCRQRLLEEDKIENFKERFETVQKLKTRPGYIDEKGDIDWQKVEKIYGEEETIELKEATELFDEKGDIIWARAHHKFNYRDEKGGILWEKVPVVKLTYSERGRRGLASFEPAEKKAQDSQTLLARKDSSKMGQFREDDPRIYNPREGILLIANQGIFEGREGIRLDPSIMRACFISLCEEKQVKPPEGTLPHIYRDVLVIFHTNVHHYLEFRNDPKNEALHSRIRVIPVPSNMRLSEEKKIYRKLLKEKIFKKHPGFEKIHIEPYTEDILALFAIRTRIKDSKLCPDPMKKIRYLNGEEVIEEEAEVIDLDELRKESIDEKDFTKSEGMSGVDTRFIQDALERAMIQIEERGCLFPVDVLDSLKEQFPHSMLLTPEQKGKFKALLESEIRPWYNEKIKQVVINAFIYGHGDARNNILDNYFREVRSWHKKELIWDKDLQAKRKASERYMREVEEAAGISKAEVPQFRIGFLARMGSYEKGEFEVDSFPKLAKGIDKKLERDLGDTAQYAIADESPRDPKVKKRRSDAIAALIEKEGFSEKGAAHALRYYHKIKQEEQE